MSRLLLTRHALSEVLEATRVSRVTLIHGPRQSGKTTLAREVCRRLGGTFASLDDVAVLNAARRDPAGFVAQPWPLVIDEIQRAGDPRSPR